MKLLTQEDAWSYLDSEQDTILLLPPKRLVTGICRNLPTDRKTLTVLQDSSSSMLMIEVVVKVLDFLGEQNKILRQIYRFLPDADSVKMSDPLDSLLSFALHEKNTLRSIGHMISSGMTLYYPLKSSTNIS